VGGQPVAPIFPWFSGQPCLSFAALCFSSPASFFPWHAPPGGVKPSAQGVRVGTGFWSLPQGEGVELGMVHPTGGPHPMSRFPCGNYLPGLGSLCQADLCFVCVVTQTARLRRALGRGFELTAHTFFTRSEPPLHQVSFGRPSPPLTIVFVFNAIGSSDDLPCVF
jgi:hypothetical protein